MPSALFHPSVLIAIGIAFWSFIAIVVVAGILYANARSREMNKTIRYAIEKGVQIDPELIDKLDVKKPVKPENYYIGGILGIAGGVGFPVLGYFIGKLASEAFPPLAGLGIMAGLVGFSLIACGKIIERGSRSDKAGSA